MSSNHHQLATAGQTVVGGSISPHSACASAGLYQYHQHSLLQQSLNPMNNLIHHHQH